MNKTRVNKTGSAAISSGVWQDAAHWVDRLGDDRSPTDLAAFEVWRAQSPAHAQAYDSLLRTAQDRALTEALQACEREAAHKKKGHVKKVRAPLLYWGMGAAALAYGISALVVFGPEIEVYLAPKMLVVTQSGDIRTLELADGSQITLNGTTRLEYVLTEHRRLVRLDQGEAYFKVQHDENRPFTVALKAGEVHDLGTEFDISYLKPDAPDAEVKVYHGAVRLKVSNTYGDLNPGEGAQVVSGVIGPRQRFDIQAADWRQGWIEPQDWTLERVTEALSRHSGQKIVFTDATLKHKRITGRLRLSAPEDQLKTLAEVHGFQVRARGDVLVIG